MKSRNGFVSNSSSSSFMVNVEKGTVERHLYFDIWEVMEPGEFKEELIEYVRSEGLTKSIVTIDDRIWPIRQFAIEAEK